MKKVRKIIVSGVLLVAGLQPMISFAETLSGQVVDKQGIPVPGMEVKLFHPEQGASRPRYTNQKGVFNFDYVPPVQGSYDIELYWMGQLVFRKSIAVKGDVELDPIHL